MYNPNKIIESKCIKSFDVDFGYCQIKVKYVKLIKDGIIIKIKGAEFADNEIPAASASVCTSKYCTRELAYTYECKII